MRRAGLRLLAVSVTLPFVAASAPPTKTPAPAMTPATSAPPAGPPAPPPTATTATPAPPAGPTAPPAPPAPPAVPSDPRFVRARTAAEELKRQLTGAVEAAVAAGGAAGAIDVCATTAPTLTAALSGSTLTIGRSSARLRNPANAPRPWVQPLLAELERVPAPQRGPRTVELPDHTLGVVLPIVTGKLCLQCHGTDVAPDVRAALERRYPKDQATGYREGDLRGVFWVEAR
jgi:hypothetical protein